MDSYVRDSFVSASNGWYGYHACYSPVQRFSKAQDRSNHSASVHPTLFKKYRSWHFLKTRNCERERERNGQHSSSRTPKIVCVSRTASMARRGKLWIIRGMWSLVGSTAPALIVVDVEILTMTQGETSWLCMTFLADPYLSFFNHLTCQTGSWRS